MNKLFSLFCAVLVALSVSATEHLVWSGNHPISWNQGTYVGSAITVYNFNGLAAGDRINIYGTPQIEGVEYALQYKAGNNWAWTTLDGLTVKNNVATYVVSSAEIASLIESRGLIVTGCGYDVTKITVTTGNGQKEVWYQDEMHIYYTDETHNNSFDTRPDIEQPGLVDFSSLRQGYTLKVYTENPVEYPFYQLQYKAGDGWTWTPIATSADANGIIAYEIASIDVAQEIRDRGLIVNGNGYYINRISVESAANYTLWDGETTPDEKTGWWWLNGQGYLVSDVSSLKAGDKLILTISATSGSDRQLKIENQLTEGETPTFGDIYVTTLDNEGAQTVEVTLSEDNVTALKTGFGGIIATGTGCTLTKIELQKADKNIEEHTLWKYHGKQISWNNEYYPGEQYYTYSGSCTCHLIDFSGLTDGATIRFYVTAGANSPSYQICDRSGDKWATEVLGINTTNAPTTAGTTGELTYTVNTSKAAVIAERGLCITGQGYDLNRIVIEVPASSLTVSDDADPATKLAQLQALNEPVDFTLNRTIYCDGYFNTLCLPFSLASLGGTPLEDATVMTLVDADITGTKAGGDMALDVTIDEVSAIEAGKPYLVSFPAGDNITGMTFHNVTITATTPQTVSTTLLYMKGIFAPQNMAADTDNQLFLGADNTLYWSDGTDPLKGFRAYFETKGVSVPKGMPARFVRPKMPTATEQTQSKGGVQKVLRDGQLIIIRDGKEYTVSGTQLK